MTHLDRHHDYVVMSAELGSALQILAKARFRLPSTGERELENEIIDLENALITYRRKILDKAGLPY